MASGNTRIIRYAIFALIAVFIIYIISSQPTIPKASLGTSTNSAYNKWKDRKLPKTSQSVATNEESDADSPPSRLSADGQISAVASGLDSKIKSATGAAPTTPALRSSNGSPFPDSLAIPSDARMNATFVTLARNSDIWEIVESIRHVEDRFNRRYHYDWVFLNDKPFDEEFKKVTTALVSGTTHYGIVPTEHWSFPEWIDQDKAKKVREDMAARKIIYGDSISYRHMCRYESGFFFRHEIMLNYEWYWRVEPSIRLFCDIDFDPFRYMVENKKKYSFVISLYEYVETIPTIWDSVKKFMKQHPEHISQNNGMKWLSDDGGETYNHCHFWSNFEVGNLNWLRSPAYIDFFETLDKDGGFFYERWGDAPVHSIAANLLLDRSELHFFDQIGYWHVPFTHCPTDEKQRLQWKCTCNPKDNFDWKGYSCTTKWFDMNNLPKPDGWKIQAD